MRTRALAALLTLTVPLLGACSQTSAVSSDSSASSPVAVSASASASASVPASGNWFSVDGVEFRLPKGWQQIKASDVSGSVSGTNSAFKTYLSSAGMSLDQFKQMASRVDLWAFAPRPKHAFLDNVNVIKAGQGSIPTSGEVNLQLKQIGAKLTGYRKLTTAAGPAVRYTYSYTLAKASLSLAGVGIMIDVNGSIVALTFSSGTAADAKAIANLSQSSLQPTS